MRASTIIMVLIAAGLSACQQDDAVLLDMGYDYFPTEVGHWVEYQVDSVWRDEQFGGQPIEAHYRMREVIAANITDAEGRPAQRLERYVLDSLGNWIIRDVWTVTRTATTLERFEENRRKLRLIFRVKRNLFWDLNVYNTQDERELTYTEVDVPWQADSTSFDSTALVRSTYPNNIIDTLIDTERYAKHVGLVYKQWIESNTQWSQQQQQFLTTGWNMTMKYVDHGGS